MPTSHLLIKGIVQGVFYRATAKKIAEKFNLVGWIRNTPAGDVEAMITGEPEKIEEFINWCWKGPEKATVTDVIITSEIERSFDNFEVIRGR